MEKDSIVHVTCSSCNKELTSGSDDIEYKTHFDLTRAKKSFIVEDGYVIEEDDKNEKMRRVLCTACFEKVLSESPTLSKLFTPSYPSAYRWIY